MTQRINKTALAVTVFALAVALVTLAAAAYVAHSAYTSIDPDAPPPPRILPADPPLPPADQHLPQVLAEAMLQDRRSTVVKHLTITLPNSRPFRDNLTNIAVQRGWYTHDPSRGVINLVMPESDLPQLTPMITDPISWTNANRSNTLPAKPPDNLDLVNVRILIQTSSEPPTGAWAQVILLLNFLLALAGAALIFAACFLARNHILTNTTPQRERPT